MTFRRNDRPLFTEILGPLLGLKEEWAAQGWFARGAGPVGVPLPLPRLPAGCPPPTPGFAHGCEEVILEETEDRCSSPATAWAGG